MCSGLFQQNGLLLCQFQDSNKGIKNVIPIIALWKCVYSLLRNESYWGVNMVNKKKIRQIFEYLIEPANNEIPEIRSETGVNMWKSYRKIQKYTVKTRVLWKEKCNPPVACAALRHSKPHWTRDNFEKYLGQTTNRIYYTPFHTLSCQCYTNMHIFLKDAKIWKNLKIRNFKSYEQKCNKIGIMSLMNRSCCFIFLLVLWYI